MLWQYYSAHTLIYDSSVYELWYKIFLSLDNDIKFFYPWRMVYNSSLHVLWYTIRLSMRYGILFVCPWAIIYNSSVQALCYKILLSMRFSLVFYWSKTTKRHRIQCTCSVLTDGKKNLVLNWDVTWKNISLRCIVTIIAPFSLHLWSTGSFYMMLMPVRNSCNTSISWLLFTHGKSKAVRG